jgi:hypothetical protein
MAGTAEGRMSGHMVVTQFGGTNAFYMVNCENAERARTEVDKITGESNARTLSELSDETLEHFDVQPGKPWLCFSTLPLGEVINSQFE